MILRQNKYSLHKQKKEKSFLLLLIYLLKFVKSLRKNQDNTNYRTSNKVINNLLRNYMTRIFTKILHLQCLITSLCIFKISKHQQDKDMVIQLLLKKMSKKPMKIPFLQDPKERNNLFNLLRIISSCLTVDKARNHSNQVPLNIDKLSNLKSMYRALNKNHKFLKISKLNQCWDNLVSRILNSLKSK